MITDTHSHIFAEEFDSDRQEAIQRAKQAGVGRILLPNIDLNSIEPMLQLCKEEPGYCLPMIGLHPTEIKDDYRETLKFFHSELRKQDHPFIAIGEIGLDLYWEQESLEVQREVFRTQLEWAVEFNLPVAIHCRSAHREMLDIMNHFDKEQLSGIFHCFGGTSDEAIELLEWPNFALGIGGVVTYKKSNLPEVLGKTIPMNRIVLETDCPYLAPVPFRGKRNETSYIVHTAERVASIYGVSTETLTSQTTATANKIMNLES